MIESRKLFTVTLRGRSRDMFVNRIPVTAKKQDGTGMEQHYTLIECGFVDVTDETELEHCLTEAENAVITTAMRRVEHQVN